MPNNCLLVLYKHIIQVENKNVALKVWGGEAQTYHCPPPHSKKGARAPPPPPLPTPYPLSPHLQRQCYCKASYGSEIYVWSTTQVQCILLEKRNYHYQEWRQFQAAEGNARM